MVSELEAGPDFLLTGQGRHKIKEVAMRLLMELSSRNQYQDELFDSLLDPVSFIP